MGYMTTIGTFRLVQEPELKELGGGTSVLKLRCAVLNRAKKGEKSTSLFIDVEAWGDLAVNAAPNLSKGQEIMLAGRLQEDEWAGKDGETKRKLKVTASDLGWAASRWPDRDSEDESRGSHQRLVEAEEAF